MSKLFVGLCLAALALVARAAPPRNVLFVDTGNTGRSVCAEALGNALVRSDQLALRLLSRGVDVDPFEPFPEGPALELMMRRGLDLRGHVAAQLQPGDVRHADLILTLTAKHRDTVIAQYPDAAGKTHLLAQYAVGRAEDVPDPWGKPIDVYDAMLHQLDVYVPAALKKAASEGG